MTTTWIRDLILQHETLGYALMFTGPFLEGLTIPCPSMIIVFIGGAFLVDSLAEYFLLVLISSLAYTLAALIPYYCGSMIKNKIEFFIQEKYWLMFDRLFTIHGDKIVCYSRPLWIGNMVSYFAGIQKMKKRRFIYYTFLGIFPWHLIVLLTGRFFGNNIEAGIEFVQNYAWLAAIIVIGVLLTSTFFKTYLEKVLKG
jgi:membrane protein DedA with SNARE-associated domain